MSWLGSTAGSAGASTAAGAGAAAAGVGGAAGAGFSALSQVPASSWAQAGGGSGFVGFLEDGVNSGMIQAGGGQGGGGQGGGMDINQMVQMMTQDRASQQKKNVTPYGGIPYAVE